MLNTFHYLNHKTFEKDRHNGLGSSDTPIVLEQSKYMTRYSLYRQKKFHESEEPTEETKNLFKAGHRQEPVTICEFLESQGEKLTDKVYQHHIKKKRLPKDGNIHLFTEFNHKVDKFRYTHPDMIYKMGKRWINFEAKYIRHKHNDWNFEYKKNGLKYGCSSDIPYHVWIQCQDQMMLTGTTKTILGANYQGADYYYYEIPVLKEFQKTLRSWCFEFWNRIQDGEPPEPRTENDTKKMFPAKTHNVVHLDGQLMDELMLMKVRHEFLKGQLKKYKKEDDEIKAFARALLTDNNAVQTADGEEVIRLSESETEKHTALSVIKKEHPAVYKYLKSKGLILPKFNSKVIF